MTYICSLHVLCWCVSSTCLSENMICYNIHICSHCGPYECDICNQRFKVAKSVKKHRIRRHGVTIQRHIHTVHEGHKNYECDICNQSFKVAKSVKEHRVRSHGTQ